MLSVFSRQVNPPAKSSRRYDHASPGSGDDANWWMITLSDLTLLLLGFLVVWYATEKRMQPIEGRRVNAAERADQPVAAVAPTNKSLQADGWRNFKKEMQNFIADAGLSEDVSVESTESDFLVSLNDTVPFASGRAEISAQARPVLDKVASVALGHPGLLLEITGHTDSVPIATATFPSNWELSAARASRVARYLIEKGVDPSRIAVRGYANQRPKLPDSDPATRRVNRRVELRLYGNAGFVAPADSDETAP
jgi:chemotaxis protein MotB